VSKLLLIDDEEGVRKIFSLYLRKEGYDVLTAEDGEKGLRIFEREKPPLVLTDIKMPGMNGVEVLKKIKEIDEETEVIIITGHGDMDLAIQSLKFGASDFITKPINDEALSIALERAKERWNMRKKLKEYTFDLEKMIEAATEEMRRRYEFENKLIQSSIDGIVATDEKGIIVIYNKGAEAIFGYPRNEVVRKMSIFDLYPPWIAEKFRECLLHKKCKRLYNWDQTTIIRKDSQQIPVAFSGAILFEKKEIIGSVGFIHDLTKIKHLEEELIKSERLAAIGQTVAGLAHYIKNVLIGLKGGAYIVNSAIEKKDINALKNGWKMVERSIHKISTLTLDLLSYSKKREPQYQRCLPNNIIEEICSLFETHANRHNIGIIKKFDNSIGEVYMDSEALHRCTLNLISNAIDACICDHNYHDKEKSWFVEVKTILEENNRIRVEVTDNGCGMDENTKNRLFTSFFSTKGGKGTGLGLLVTQKIISELGGTIEVQSELGKGSTFTIRLPYKKMEN
jgi:PAS domain S-box-containing protein